MRMEWNGAVKKVLAAVLYVVGAASVLFVAYQERALHSPVLGYLPLYGVGIVLVAVSALLWPSPERGEGCEDSKDSGATGEVKHVGK